MVRNATIWIGEETGTIVVSGGVTLDGGIIKAIRCVFGGTIPKAQPVEMYDGMGTWITPGFGRFWHLPVLFNLI